MTFTSGLRVHVVVALDLVDEVDGIDQVGGVAGRDLGAQVAVAARGGRRAAAACAASTRAWRTAAAPSRGRS